MAQMSAVVPCELLLGDLHFGTEDAQNEGRADAEAFKFFLDSFIEPQAIDIKEYLSGEKFFIRGRRGTGKTAFLRYIGEQTFDPDTKKNHRYVIFKEMSEAEKAAISASAAARENDGAAPHDSEIDMSYGWRVFLHKELARLICDNLDLVENTDVATDYLKEAESFFDSEGGKSDVLTFLEKIKEGYIDVPLIGKIGIRTHPKAPKRVMVSELSRRLSERLREITLRKGAQLVLLIDELNPSTKQTRDRDYSLIRNLVVAVDVLNKELRKHHGNSLLMICAVRSEVMQLVDPQGTEIAKRLKDNGDEILWRKRNPEDGYHLAPIIRYVRLKIQAAERRKCGKAGNDDHVWSTYFDDKIFGIPPQVFIYQMTWARPRDVNQLLQTAVKASKKAKKFHDDVFRRVQTEVQKEFWRERQEELRLAFEPNEVLALERLLLEFNREFSKSEFEGHLENLSREDAEIKTLTERYSAQHLLQELYKAGVIGNKHPSGRQLWEHEWDAHPKMQYVFVVHRGLWLHLRLI